MAMIMGPRSSPQMILKRMILDQDQGSRNLLDQRSRSGLIHFVSKINPPSKASLAIFIASLFDLLQSIFAKDQKILLLLNALLACPTRLPHPYAMPYRCPTTGEEGADVVARPACLAHALRVALWLRQLPVSSPWVGQLAWR
ncbi:hypothetical protein [Streptomyces qinglanensis]|uniref:hypothetical protein n=1 Tax=Streptomyces qinglanensis TaxID=943816 RepID=UPI001160DCE7|nr:hypothetical protein [Streptomyces qinglanensis]